MSIEQLAKQFIELVKERDSEVDYFGGYNGRCYEIDDKLIPKILDQVPSNEMDRFNQLINAKSE